MVTNGPNSTPYWRLFELESARLGRSWYRVYPPATERAHRVHAHQEPQTSVIPTSHRKGPSVVRQPQVNTATPASRVKHPGTGPSSGSTLQAVDLHTIEGRRADVRNTQSSRSDLQKKSAQSIFRGFSLSTEVRFGLFLCDPPPLSSCRADEFTSGDYTWLCSCVGAQG